MFVTILNDESVEIDEYESAIVSYKSVVIFPQKDDAKKFDIRLDERT